MEDGLTVVSDGRIWGSRAAVYARSSSCRDVERKVERNNDIHGRRMTSGAKLGDRQLPDWVILRHPQ